MRPLFKFLLSEKTIEILAKDMMQLHLNLLRPFHNFQENEQAQRKLEDSYLAKLPKILNEKQLQNSLQYEAPGSLEVFYQESLKLLKETGHRTYCGNTSQPAVMNLAVRLNRQKIATHYRRQGFFEPSHFDLSRY